MVGFYSKKYGWKMLIVFVPLTLCVSILDCASINTMADFISVFLIAAVLVKSTLSSSQQISPLNGHHLRVLGIEVSTCS